MISKRQITAIALIGAATGAVACAPTVKIDFAKPLEINANLRADVYIKLDEELKRLFQENPNLF